MSIEAVISRVSQLQAMLGGAAPAPPAPSPTSSFSTALQKATGATATQAPSPAVSPASAASSLPAGTPYAAEITAAATRNGVDPALLAGLVKQESGFNPNAGSPAGARGLGVTDLHDPVQSIEGGAKYLAQQLKTFHGDVARALAAYNAGPGAVQRYGGVPPYAETQNYVRIVQANAAQYRAACAGTPSIL